MDLTHKMVHHIIKLEQAVVEIKNTPLTLSSKKKIVERMSTESIYNVAKLINIEISFREAENISKGKTLSNPGSPITVLNNYRSTCDFIYSASNDRYMSISPSLLMHFNKLLLNGVIDTWDTGRFRNVSDKPNSLYDPWLSSIETRPQVDYQTHYYDVLTWFLENKYFIHPIIKIACVIYELFKYYPLVSGNELTIVAFSEYLFEKTKLSLHGLLPVSRNFVLYEDEYLDAIENSIRTDDLTNWIETFVRCIALDINSLKNEVIRLEEEKIKKKKKTLLDLNSRQLKLLRYLRIKSRISRKEYVNMMGVSTMTAYRDLDELVARSLIQCRGGGRSTHYMLQNEETEAKKSQPEEQEYKKHKIVKVINDFDNPAYDSNFESNEAVIAGNNDEY